MTEAGSTGTPSGGAERRVHNHLREIFDQAYELAAPMFEGDVSSTAHFLRITIHDAFPHLHQQDVSILCVAIERTYRDRKKVRN